MRGSNARLACAVAVGVALAAAALPSSASAVATPCNNQTPLIAGGEDVWVDAGPGVVLVGADVGGIKGTDPADNNFVCVGSDVVPVNSTVHFDDEPGGPATAAPGCTADLPPAAGCDVGGVRIGFTDADGTPVLAVNGIVVVPDGGCVAAVGTTC